jgi:hypothetical protein
MCGEERCITGFRWGTPEGKRPLGRPRRRWEGSIKINLEVIVWEKK